MPARSLLAWMLVGALAPAPEPDPLREQAAAAFAEGSAAFERGEPAVALAAFQRAQALVPHAKVQSNIALCLAELGRHREAIAELEAAIDSGELSLEERSVAQLHLERSRRSTAALHIALERAGPAAQIGVDADTECTTPCSLTLDPGAHRIAVIGGGYTTRVELGAGSTTTLRVPAAAIAPPPVIADPLPPPPPHPIAPAHFGALGWVGLGVAIVGGGATLGFGLGARALHREYFAMPTDITRSHGITLRNLANASIAVAATGGVLLVTELVRLAIRRKRERSRAPTR
jgi:PEGA domain